MLAYVQRAPLQVALQPRVALTAIRLWAAEMRRSGCSIGALRALFARVGVSGALWPAHNFLYWVHAHAARPISLGCPCCGRISDDEELLLAAIFATGTAPARVALNALVTPATLDGAVRLAQRFGREFARELLDEMMRTGLA